MIEQSPANDEASPSASGIHILSISPPPGSSVQKSTMLVADLAYNVKDADSGVYILFPMFDKIYDKRYSAGAFRNHPFLKYARGTIKFCFPMADIWGERNLRTPLAFRFFLNKLDKLNDPTHFHIVATTEKIYFPIKY